ncbi:MAG: tRNA (adenosine(37)-N6)-threonylcarbamoyltransferase complex ATPase subunit type 1 TsaE [Desulfuromonadales bacterium]
MSGLEITSNSPFETEELGGLLGHFLSAGSFVALRGGLGGGKTCFTRGIVAAVAPQDAHKVSSPTFAIMNSYVGDTPVYHFDFYRLAGDNDIAELGFDDYFYGDGVCVIEWSERISELLPDDYITVRFEYKGENQRVITLNSCGSKSINILEQLVKQRTSYNFL